MCGIFVYTNSNNSDQHKFENNTNSTNNTNNTNNTTSKINTTVDNAATSSSTSDSSSSNDANSVSSSEPEYGSDSYVEKWDESERRGTSWSYTHDQPVKTGDDGHQYKRMYNPDTGESYWGYMY